MSSIDLNSDEEKPKRYSFYSTPDGDDCLKKLIFLSKNGALLGLFSASMDVALFSRPKGYGAILGRYAYCTLPITGMGAAFAAATCASANIRKKDDKMNHAIGGLAAGGIWGAWLKSYRFGVYGGFALALLAVLVKDSYQNNWDLFPENKNRKNPFSPYWISQDWSLAPDPGRTWKRADEV